MPYKHGLRNHPLYPKWQAMKNRCKGTTRKRDQKHYLYKGIRVCDEWQEFVPFYKWALENGWDSGLTIDRKNNNDGYYPANCRFVSKKINGQNQSTSKYWFIFGKRFESSKDAAKVFGCHYRTIHKWCSGYISRGKYYNPIPLCYSVNKY